MNLIISLNQYNEDCVYFGEVLKNNIMDNSNFIRIVYSTSLFSLNGIYLMLNVNYTSVDKYFNKFKCVFDVNSCREMIDKLYAIEHGLLQKIGIVGKTPLYKITDQMRSGSIRVFSDNDKFGTTCMLKIAGLWETETEYGLTYKIVFV